MMEYAAWRAMNTDITLAAEGDPAALPAGFAQARALVSALEARFTRFEDTSELSALNRSAGRWFAASAELFEVVCRARELAAETDGLYDPSILPALEDAGYDRSMDAIRASGVSRLASPGAAFRIGVQDVRLDPASRSVFLPEGMRLDLGGIAKGWIAQQAARQMATWSRACALDAGGDIVACGLPEGSPCWEIGLENPLDPARDLAVLRMPPGAVATSSVVKRRWQQGDRTRHHLIDPRTGLPAQTDWLCVTVMAADAAVAEVYAKAILIAGPADAERLAARRDGLAFLAVDSSGQLWGSRNVGRFLNASFKST